MLRTRLLTIFVAVMSVPAQDASADKPDRKSDEAAIKAVIGKRTEGFNKKDAAAQASLFTKDADFYGSNGTVSVVGRKRIELLLSFVLKGVFKNATLEQKVTKISFVSPEIALVTIDLTMKRAEKDGGTYKNRGLRVMVKHDGVWKIRTFMNQRVLEGGVTQAEFDKAIEAKLK
jgi:uncharacterized protein (TIGR02246 family)